MPGKAETPKPPRRVQAPKQRATPRTPDERRTWRTMIVLGALGFIGLAVALGFIFFGRESAAEAITNAGCTLRTFEGQGQDHVEALPEGFEYNSTPATTGPHNPVAAPFDFYDEPVDQLRLVHNQEHGGVVVHYGPDAPVDELREWWRDDPNGIVVTPHESLEGSQVAMTAWTADFSGSNPEATDQRGVLAECPAWDAGAADAFVDEYGFRGPERFERIMLAPGS
jgi:hypothetical protein